MATFIVKEAIAQCSPCKRNKEEVPAVFWCNNCNECLCKQCSSHHTRNKASSHHKVLPLSDIQSELLLLDKLDINTQCETHPDHQKTVFCEDDDVFCCTVCLSTDHRRCNNVQSIDSAAKAYTSGIREIDIQGINTLVVLVDRMIEKRKSVIKEAKLKSTDFLRQVQARFDIAMEELQRKRTRVEEDIKKAKQKVTQFHGQCLVSYENIKTELKDNLQVLHAHQKLSPAQHMITRHKTFHAFKKQAKETFNIVSSDIPEMKISFSDTLNMEIIKLGSVAIEQRKSEDNDFLTECDMIIDRLYRHLYNKGAAQIARELLPLISCDTSFVASADRSNIQAGISTPDGTYLPDNTILLCDSKHDQLIKLDENLGFLEKLPVAEKPDSVCVSSDGSYVHVVCDGDKVVSYALHGPWREVHRFGTELNAYKIACHGDRIVTGHGVVDEKYVVIYDSKGTEISRINTAGCSWYSVLSRDRRMLYHGDGCHDVVCRSIEELKKQVWRYSTQKLWGPRGVDTDRDGNILIVGQWSHNIHQVSGDGKLNRIIVNKMKYMEDPWGLFYNSNNNTFCVTSEFDKVCIEMYRFEDSFKDKRSPKTPKQKSTFNFIASFFFRNQNT